MNEVGTAPGPPEVTWEEAADRRWQAARETLTGLRKQGRAGNPWPYRLYVWAIVAVPCIAVLARAAVEADPLPATDVAALLEWLAVGGPAVLLAIFAISLRVIAWHGVVLIPRSDIAWLLGAPLPRVRIMAPRVLRMLWTLGAIGGLLGLGAAVAVATLVGAPARALAAITLAGALGGAVTGTLVGACGWLVQCHLRWARAVLRTALTVAAAAAVVAVAAWTGAFPSWAAAVALWSGPWGWVLVPVVGLTDGVVAARATGDVAGVWGVEGTGWVVALALTGLAAACAIVAAFKQTRSVPLEELRRREATSVRLLASAVYAADLRGASQARREAVTELARRRHTSHHAPVRPCFAAPWASALLLLRSRERLAHALGWVAATAGLGVALAGGPSLVLAQAVSMAAYPAASALLEPVRIELEQRFMERTSVWPLARIVRAQGAVSAACLAVLGVTVAGILGLLGVVPRGQPLALLLAGVLLAAPLLCACGVVIATGPGPRADWLYLGDIGLSMIGMYLMRGPLLSAAVLGPLVALMAALASSSPAAVPMLGGLVWTVAALLALERWSRVRLGRYQ